MQSVVQTAVTKFKPEKKKKIRIGMLELRRLVSCMFFYIYLIISKQQFKKNDKSTKPVQGWHEFIGDVSEYLMEEILSDQHMPL